LENVDRFESEAIDLTGRISDFVIQTPIRADDELIEFSSSPVVEVRGIIREVIVEKTFETVEISYSNLSPDLAIDEPEVFGSIKLSGPQLTVESLRANDLTLAIECADITVPGSYELPVEMTLPPGISPISFQPSMVVVSVSALPAPDEPATEGEGS
jgi:hypothetical protein